MGGMTRATQDATLPVSTFLWSEKTVSWEYSPVPDWNF